MMLSTTPCDVTIFLQYLLPHYNLFNARPKYVTIDGWKSLCPLNRLRSFLEQKGVRSWFWTTFHTGMIFAVVPILFSSDMLPCSYLSSKLTNRSPVQYRFLCLPVSSPMKNLRFDTPPKSRQLVSSYLNIGCCCLWTFSTFRLHIIVPAR